MRTTIDLPDDLIRQVKARAALDGLRLKDLITRFVEQGLKQGSLPPGARAKRSELPVIRGATGHPVPSLTNAEIDRLLDADEVRGGRTD
jgi:hypothetical protein